MERERARARARERERERGLRSATTSSGSELELVGPASVLKSRMRSSLNDHVEYIDRASVSAPLLLLLLLKIGDGINNTALNISY